MAELVDERRKVAKLRRKVAELQLLLEAPTANARPKDAEAGGAGDRLGPRGVTLPRRWTVAPGNDLDGRSV